MSKRAVDDDRRIDPDSHWATLLNDKFVEQIDVTLSIRYYPDYNTIRTAVKDISSPFAPTHKATPTASTATATYLEKEFGLTVTDHDAKIHPEVFEPEVTVEYYGFTDKDDTTLPIDETPTVDVDDPAVGDHLTIDYETVEGIERVTGRVTDTTQLRDEHGDTYWEIEVELNSGRTIAFSTVTDDPMVRNEECSDGDEDDILGELHWVSHAANS